jgi:integrase
MKISNSCAVCNEPYSIELITDSEGVRLLLACPKCKKKMAVNILDWSKPALAHIARRTDRNTWYVWWLDPEGKKKTMSCESKEDAEFQKLNVEKQLNRHKLNVVVERTWQEVEKEFLDNEKLAMKAPTYATIKLAFTHFNTFAKPAMLSDWTPQAIDKFIQGRLADGVEKETVNQNLRNLRKFQNWLLDRKYITEKVKIKELPVKTPAPILLNEKEIGKLLEAAKIESPWMYLFTRIKLASAQRTIDVLDIAIDQIDFEHNIITFHPRKTPEKTLHIHIKKSVMDEITAWLTNLPDGQKWLFFADDPKQKYADKLMDYGLWKKIVKRAGIKKKINPHDLRDTTASMVANKYGINVALQLTGHTDPKTLKRHYLAVNDATLSAAAENLPID